MKNHVQIIPFLVLFLLLLSSKVYSQDTISHNWFEIDSTYFQNNLINSGWGLEDEKNDGSIVAFVFRGERFDFMYLNFTYGGEHGLCDYEYTFRGKYTYLQFIACEDNSRKRFPPVIFYLIDENTLMFCGTAKEGIKNIDQVPAEEWYRFERVDPNAEIDTENWEDQFRDSLK